MKKFNVWKRIVLFIFVAAFSAQMISCSNSESDEQAITNSVELKSDEQAANLEALQKDPEFIQFLKMNMLDLNVVDMGVVKELSSRELQDSDINNLALALGYKDRAEYEANVNTQSRIAQSLDAKYGIFNMDGEILQPIIVKGFEDIMPIEIYDDPCWCKRKLRNDNIIANAAAALGTVGCLAADATVIAGIICHAAVFTALAAQLDNNQIAFDECQKACK